MTGQAYQLVARIRIKPGKGHGDLLDMVHAVHTNSMLFYPEGSMNWRNWHPGLRVWDVRKRYNADDGPLY